jgi:hypothetical protein
MKATLEPARIVSLRRHRRRLARCVGALAGVAALGGCAEGPAESEVVRAVRLDPDTAYVMVNTTAQLRATARSASGKVLANAVLRWSSSDTTVATVSGTGLVLARSYGDASITATAEGATASSVVRVTGTPGVRVLSSGVATDTISAIVADPFVVEVRDARGLPLPGAAVVFRSTMEPLAAGQPLVHHLSLRRLDSTFDSWFIVTVPTDIAGRAAVQVRLGVRAAAAGLIVSVTAAGHTDTTHFTILPGNAANVRVTPRDSTTYIGNGYNLHATVMDRGDNLLADSITYSPSSGIEMSATAAFSATAEGRRFVVAAAGQATDTAWISVVPRGTLTAFRAGAANFPYDTAGFVLVALDGSQVRRIIPTNEQYHAHWMTSSWSPDGSTLVYSDIEDPSASYLSSRIHVYRDGQVTRLPENPAVEWETRPVFSRTGEWIYYTGPASGLLYSLWRVRPDGTGAEQVIPPQFSYYPIDASFSPDGSELVYGRRDVAEDSIYILDVQTRQARRLDVIGRDPQWAPNSDLIAFTASQGELYVVRSDGTGVRRVSLPSLWYEAARWSADGRYLITRTSVAYVPGPYPRPLELVNVETGERMPLSFTGRMWAPTWMRPAP